MYRKMFIWSTFNLHLLNGAVRVGVALQKRKVKAESELKKDVKAILNSDNQDELKKTSDILGRISDSNKNDLAHYISIRRSVLDIFKKSLDVNVEGDFSSEAVVHDIIFPRKGDSLKTAFQEHNLWLIDERLNFTEYLTSDLPLSGVRSSSTRLISL